MTFGIKLQWVSVRIKSDKIDGFTMVLDDKIEHSVLLEYENRFT